MAELRGRAAHAGVRPEAGRSAIAAAAAAIAAMRSGGSTRRRPPTSGRSRAAPAINVVPERCRVEAEVRSLDEARAEAVTTEIVDHLQDAADAGECDLDLTVERMFRGYRIKPRAPQLAVAERALRACGYEPRQIVTGGASDANAFEAAGLHVPEPGRRHRAQPRAGRADQRRTRWRACSRSRSRSSTRPPWSSAAPRRRRVSGFELDRRPRSMWRGQDHHGRRRALPPRGRGGGHPREGLASRRGRDPGRRRRARLADAPAARGGRARPFAGDPGRQARRPGEPPLDAAPSASSPRRSASRRPSWGEIKAFYTSPGSATSASGCTWPATCRDAGERRARRGRADRDRPVAAGPSSTPRSPSARTPSR